MYVTSPSTQHGGYTIQLSMLVGWTGMEETEQKRCFTESKRNRIKTFPEIYWIQLWVVVMKQRLWWTYCTQLHASSFVHKFSHWTRSALSLMDKRWTTVFCLNFEPVYLQHVHPILSASHAADILQNWSCNCGNNLVKHGLLAKRQNDACYTCCDAAIHVSNATTQHPLNDTTGITVTTSPIMWHHCMPLHSIDHMLVQGAADVLSTAYLQDTPLTMPGYTRCLVPEASIQVQASQGNLAGL